LKSGDSSCIAAGVRVFFASRLTLAFSPEYARQTPVIPEKTIDQVNQVTH